MALSSEKCTKQRDATTRKMTPTTERYIFVVDITNHGRARTSTETRNMYSLVLCSSVRFSGRNITAERYILVGDDSNHG